MGLPGENNRVTLSWVLGHTSAEGNEHAGKLGRVGESSLLGSEYCCGLRKA